MTWPFAPIRLLSERTAVGRAAASLYGSGLISSLRLIFHRSSDRLVSFSGSQTIPRVAPFDFSGLRFGLPTLTAATEAEQSLALAPGAGTPFGQRIGSRAVAVPVDCDSIPDSAGPGARKPSEYVPRRANVFSGVHFAPTFGVLEE